MTTDTRSPVCRQPSGLGYTLTREAGHWKPFKHERWMTDRPVMKNYWHAHAAALKADSENADYKRACDILVEEGAVRPDSGIPVFLQKWWLNTVGNAVSVHEVHSFEGSEVIGSLSHIEHFNKAGILFGGNLPWTTLGGPILAQNLSEDRKRQVLDQLLAQLPKRTSFIFVCSAHATDADLIEQSFKRAGFALFKRVTYSRSPDDVEVLRLLKRKSRAHIKAADKNLTAIDISAEEFADFYAANLRDAGAASYSPLHVARDLIAEGISRKQVRAIAAKKRIIGSLDNRPFDAAIACAWDEYRYYYWLSTSRQHSDGNAEAKANPDAIKVLILRAMSHA